MSRVAHSATLSFGLVSIPTKLYLAAASENFEFCMVSPKGNKVRLQPVDAATDELISRENCQRGYEVAKDQLVVFSTDELDALSEGKSNVIELIEFVDVAHFDPVAVEKTYWLAPDKGAEKSFCLLMKAMQATHKMCVAKWYSSGRDHLVLVVASEDRLTLFQLFYTNEIRGYEYQFSEKSEPSSKELTFAKQLIKKLGSDEFDLKAYSNEYSERVRMAIEAKQMGQQIKAVPALQIAGQPFDLVAMLEKSLEEEKPKAKKKGAKSR